MVRPGWADIRVGAHVEDRVKGIASAAAESCVLAHAGAGVELIRRGGAGVIGVVGAQCVLDPVIGRAGGYRGRVGPAQAIPRGAARVRIEGGVIGPAGPVRGADGSLVADSAVPGVTGRATVVWGDVAPIPTQGSGVAGVPAPGSFVHALDAIMIVRYPVDVWKCFPTNLNGPAGLCIARTYRVGVGACVRECTAW
ncbi:MAG TPA: hypothetical protein PLN83_01850 [Syntrophorhabdus sp.]|nr:hypothetical protein [Syntrophorhabdus sp.]